MFKRLALLTFILLIAACNTGCSLTDPLTTVKPYAEYGAKVHTGNEEPKAYILGGLDFGANDYGRLQVSTEVDSEGETEIRINQRVEF